MAELKVGQPAPIFTLPSSEEKPISLKDYKGQMVLLYFYPQDESTSCSIEAVGFRDNYLALEDEGIVVLGISPDNLASHRQFIKKYDLPFSLLSDVDHTVAKLYGVWGEQSAYGKKYWGVERVTYIIDKDGIIKEVLHRIKPEEHAQVALEKIKKILNNK